MDATCGSAVFQALPKPMTIATLDLRIDYVKLGTPRRDILLHAHCYKVTRSVAFARFVVAVSTEACALRSDAYAAAMSVCLGLAVVLL